LGAGQPALRIVTGIFCHSHNLVRIVRLGSRDYATVSVLAE
jgi:hypothetical protein